MLQTQTPRMTDPERRELEFVIVHLERTPRLSALLKFLAEKYDSGEVEDATEFNIATEVFGRRSNAFIASEDSVARVQTHRLRKRLKELYEQEGRQHSLRVAIPLGTYLVTFVRHNAGAREMAQPEETIGVLEPVTLPPIVGSTPQIGYQSALQVAPSTPNIVPLLANSSIWGDGRRRTLLLVVAAVLAAVFAIVAITHVSHRAPSGAASDAFGAGASQGANASATPNHVGVSIPFRAIAGYDGPPKRDSDGNIWQPDQFFSHGWPVRQPEMYVARTSDPFVFLFGRNGDCDYDIPLAPGVYELHLYFLARSELSQSEDAENKAAFNVTLNGRIRLEDFDIVSDAEGRNIADERVIRDVSPAPDGKLHIHISTVYGTPSLSAFALLQGTPGRQLPIRIITQSAPFTDSHGVTWRPDTYFMGGRHLSHSLSLSDGGSSDALSTERYGHFSYAIPVDPRGRYTLVLHFKELFFGTAAWPGGGPGSRKFRVLCNGSTLLDGFDIAKEAGSDKELTKTVPHLAPTAQGKLNITFEPVTNYATVSSLEVIDESR